jgi:hypothetical protein
MRHRMFARIAQAATALFQAIVLLIKRLVGTADTASLPKQYPGTLSRVVAEHLPRPASPVNAGFYHKARIF